MPICQKKRGKSPCSNPDSTCMILVQYALAPSIKYALPPSIYSLSSTLILTHSDIHLLYIYHSLIRFHSLFPPSTFENGSHLHFLSNALCSNVLSLRRCTISNDISQGFCCDYHWRWSIYFQLSVAYYSTIGVTSPTIINFFPSRSCSRASQKWCSLPWILLRHRNLCCSPCCDCFDYLKLRALL